MYQYFFFANKDLSTTDIMFQPTLKDHLRITSAIRKDLNENSKKKYVPRKLSKKLDF